MSSGARTQRAQVWLETLGEWGWPGTRAATAEVLPPAWVPAVPPARAAAPQPLPAPWRRARRLLIGVLLGALAATSAALALRESRRPALPAAGSLPAIAVPHEPALLALPRLTPVARDHAGSVVEHGSYRSVALHHTGSFYVYLPPGYSAAGRMRYPVLYLLHGNSQSAGAFLQIGVQSRLDALIASRRIPPLIAVMVQGGPGANNWRNIGSEHYESYVLEVQDILDGMLPTLADRSGRAIAGLSMGGYGAMELALDNPYRFSVVESWIGFFNGLEGQLTLDRPAIRRLGLSAFVYGAAGDRIADPAEDGPFAAQLRAAGARAHSAVYPGEHSLQTVGEHLEAMLLFAGRSLAGAERGAGDASR